jgi:DNA-binding response OmpR family regulator
VATVLIAEDDPDLGAAMRLLFGRTGHRILTASDGAAALELTRRWAPDLLVLEAAMPGMTGAEVCRAVRSDPRTAAIPVMMVARRAAPGAGPAGPAPDDYVTRPFDASDIMARAEALLAHGHRRTPVRAGPR